MYPALIATCLLCLLPDRLPAAPPNLVVIFIDDMGYGDIEPFGSTINQTPNLSRMAAEGMKLTSFYAAPVCSASRAQLLTGCYAPRVSVPGVFFPAGPKGLNPDEKTVADYLKERGYVTACVGKWHLGDQPEFLPTRQGFDSYFGIPYSNDMQRRSLEDGRSVTPLLRDERVAELLEDEGQRRVTREYTQEAVAFIKRNSEQPFFLYMPHTAMHVPIYPHQDFAGRSANGRYGDWVAEVDWSVGQVLDTIREAGLAEKTMVLFTSDNGPWASKGKDGGVAGPLRGSKGGTLEGGVREPTIAWWPGHIAAGTESDQIAGTTDILPTLVHLSGGEPDADRVIDGVNLSALLLGQSAQSGRRVWHYYSGTTLQAVREGDWKLALTPQSIGMGFREQPEDIRQREPRLYNLQEDLGETTDVAASHPDVAARLQKIADAMRADIGSGKPGPGVRPAGIVSSPVTLYPTQPKSKPKPKTKGRRAEKPIDWKTVKAGDSFPSTRAPRVQQTAFQVRCRLSAADAESTGMVVSHGGSVVEYALYVSEGQVTFAIRRSADSIDRVSLPLDGTGPQQIIAALDEKWHMTISVNDRTSAPRVCGPISRVPQEALCIAGDQQNPVDPQAPNQQPLSGWTQLRVQVMK